MAEVVCYDCGVSYSDVIRDCPACALPTAISEPEKIDAEWVEGPVGRFLVVKNMPLEYFADLNTSNAIFQRAQMIADEKDGGAKADH